jgi:FixJ family two-component response regulator
MDCFRVPDPRVIAVVDDEEEVRLSTRDLLRTYGVQVATFESAEAFLAAADLATVDILITDFKMPGMNAAGLLDALRERNASFPVVVMSALETEPTRALVMEKGASAFLPKPVDPDELTQVLEGLRK